MHAMHGTGQDRLWMRGRVESGCESVEDAWVARNVPPPKL